jgi:hypothetical protein
MDRPENGAGWQQIVGCFGVMLKGKVSKEGGNMIRTRVLRDADGSVGKD